MESACSAEPELGFVIMQIFIRIEPFDQRNQMINRGPANRSIQDNSVRFRKDESAGSVSFYYN